MSAYPAQPPKQLGLRDGQPVIAGQRSTGQDIATATAWFSSTTVRIAEMRVLPAENPE